MQRTPTYIGIFGQHPSDTTNKLQNYSKQCLQQLMYQVNSLHVQQNYQNFDNKFHTPPDNYHITTLFIGKKQDSLTNPQKQLLKQFKYGTKVQIKIQFCVYVPNTIIIGYCPNLNGIQCDNTYPHVTLMLSGSTTAAQSNNVIQLLFQGNPDIMTDKSMLKQSTAKYNGKSIFVIKKQIVFDGITGDNFKNGKRLEKVLHQQK